MQFDHSNNYANLLINKLTGLELSGNPVRRWNNKFVALSRDRRNCVFSSFVGMDGVQGLLLLRIAWPSSWTVIWFSAEHDEFEHVEDNRDDNDEQEVDDEDDNIDGVPLFNKFLFNFKCRFNIDLQLDDDELNGGLTCLLIFISICCCWCWVWSGWWNGWCCCWVCCCCGIWLLLLLLLYSPNSFGFWILIWEDFALLNSIS